MLWIILISKEIKSGKKETQSNVKETITNIKDLYENRQAPQIDKVNLFNLSQDINSKIEKNNLQENEEVGSKL